MSREQVLLRIRVTCRFREICLEEVELLI